MIGLGSDKKTFQQRRLILSFQETAKKVKQGKPRKPRLNDDSCKYFLCNLIEDQEVCVLVFSVIFLIRGCG